MPSTPIQFVRSSNLFNAELSPEILLKVTEIAGGVCVWGGGGGGGGLYLTLHYNNNENL